MIFADYIKKAKNSTLEPENLGKLVEELNAKFEEKGLKTRLSKRDFIQKLSEDMHKLKTKIHLKNKRYEPSVSHHALIPPDSNQEPKN